MNKIPLVITLSLLVLTMSSCRQVYVNYTSAGGITVRALELREGDIGGWVPKSDDPFAIYVGEELTNPIDGGAPLYLDLGCLETGMQGLKGPAGSQVDVKVMDFGTWDNAVAMVKNRKSAAVDARKVPSFADSIALYDNGTSGRITGYGVFNNFYIELNFTGFTDKKQAVLALDLFLKIYSVRIK